MNVWFHPKNLKSISRIVYIEKRKLNYQFDKWNNKLDVYPKLFFHVICRPTSIRKYKQIERDVLELC